MPSNSIAFARNYTSVIDEVYQRASRIGECSIPAAAWCARATTPRRS